MLATQEELWNRLQKVFVLSKLLDQKGHFINLLQKHPSSKGGSAKRNNCFPFLFPIKCVCTVDMVNTVDNWAITLELKPLSLLPLTLCMSTLFYIDYWVIEQLNI